MMAENLPVSSARLPGFQPVTTRASRLRFDLATAQDNHELQQFGCEASMPGAIRFSFDRAPDYLAALNVEGHHSEVLLCREEQSGRLVATGHRSIKPAFVNGVAMPLGYLGGLRVAPTVRSGQLLAQGYGFLKALHTRQPAHLYLTTVMEDNQQAKKVLLSGRFGLPAYHDFGRFCCIAAGIPRRKQEYSGSGLRIRSAASADGAAIVEFLNREGSSRQFFPQYRLADFGRPAGLLAHLEWKDVFMAFYGKDLVGVLAAWDQLTFRRWRLTGYAPWLRCLRLPLNLVARFQEKPPLPSPGAIPKYFILSLPCIRQHDPAIFNALLAAILRERGSQYSFFLAGLHERDPLTPALLTRPHVPLHSRLYVVAWEDGAGAVQELDRHRVPYLELGAL